MCATTQSTPRSTVMSTSKTLLWRHWRGGAFAALVHVALLTHTIYLILTSTETNWPSYWMIFLALDFPMSLGVMPVTWLVPPAAGGPLSDITNFWWPAMYHAFVGTAWWYIVGTQIARKITHTLNARRRVD